MSKCTEDYSPYAECSEIILQIIVCTEDMISGSLWDAINTKQSNPEAVKVTSHVF